MQGEPGHGKYYDLDNVCYENNIFGHNNFGEGPESEDPYLIYINSGSVSSFAGIHTDQLTASTVTCQGGSRNVTDLCAVASIMEPRESAWASTDNIPVQEQDRVAMKRELAALRSEVERLTEVVESLSNKL